MPAKTEYTKESTKKVAAFVESIKQNIKVAENGDGVTLDSASAADYAATVINQSPASSGVELPEQFQYILDDAANRVGNTSDDNLNKKQKDAAKAMVLDSITKGIAIYKELHGTEPSADLIESAIHQGYGRTQHAAETYKATLDSASSTHHDQMSLQPNRAVVAITGAISEGIPVAHYLPADIKSNEAKLLIATHHAGSDFGEYEKNDLMDGTSSGKAFTSSSRIIKLDLDGKYKSKFTVKMTGPETCDPNGESMPLMRGRTIIYVNGFKAAMETSATGTADKSNISGEVKLDNTTYVVTGWIKPATGEVEVEPNNAFPANTKVHAEAFIDFEEKPQLVPLINTSAEAFTLYASPWKVKTEQTVDTFTQMSNEMGINPAQESMLAVRQQQANERHYKIIQMAMRLGQNNSETFDMKWTTHGANKSRADVWGDFSSVLGIVGQKMAETNMEYGPTHMYISKNVKAQLEGLPRSMFVPSGVTERPGIYRVGKFMGKDVYYAPRFVKDIDSTSSQILLIGRANRVAHNPFVLGDAVAPTIAPISQKDYKRGSEFYARNFTEVNPYQPFASSCALIDVINQN